MNKLIITSVTVGILLANQSYGTANPTPTPEPTSQPTINNTTTNKTNATALKATKIVLKLKEKRVYAYHENRVLASYPVAIGKPSTPTPTGRFQIFQMIVDPIWKNPWTGQVHKPGPNTALGLRWIGFANQSNGIIGFHGTPTVSSIGKAASNGCVRMRNEDVLALFDKVDIGTPVEVVH